MNADEAWALVIKAVRRSSSRDRDKNLVLKKLTLELEEEIQAVEMVLNLDIALREDREYFLDEMMGLREHLNYVMTRVGRELTSTVEVDWLHYEWQYTMASAEWYQAMAAFMAEIYYPLNEELRRAKAYQVEMLTSLWQNLKISNATFQRVMERGANMGIRIQRE